MHPRRRNWYIAAFSLTGMWLAHPFFVRNFETLMEERRWDRILSDFLARTPAAGAEVESYIASLLSSSPFWFGAAAVVALWGVLEFVFVNRSGERRRSFGDLFQNGPERPQAYLVFHPGSREMVESNNIKGVQENRDGSYTIMFKYHITKANFRVKATSGKEQYERFDAIENTGRILGVTVHYRVTPVTAGLEFYG